MSETFIEEIWASFSYLKDTCIGIYDLKFHQNHLVHEISYHMCFNVGSGIRKSREQISAQNIWHIGR